MSSSMHRLTRTQVGFPAPDSAARFTKDEMDANGISSMTFLAVEPGMVAFL
jgi:hypothetical protein